MRIKLPAGARPLATTAGLRVQFVNKFLRGNILGIHPLLEYSESIPETSTVFMGSQTRKDLYE